MYLNDENASKSAWSAFIGRSANGGTITATFEYQDGYNFVFVIKKTSATALSVIGYDVQNLTLDQVITNKAMQTKPYSISVPKNMVSLQTTLMQIMCNYAKTLTTSDAVV